MATPGKLNGARALRRGRYSQRDRIYHITTRTANREPVFADHPSARAVVTALQHESGAGRCRTLAYVVMPDHLHWLMQLQCRRALFRSVNNVKAHSARAINARRNGSGPIWQRGFYDRALRRDEDVAAVATYIIGNPVRAGLVSRTADYPFWGSIWPL